MRKFEKFEKLQLRSNQLCSVKGGTSTTLMVEVGRSESEYQDNGNGTFDEGDKFIAIVEMP
ncbi:hypothetical protein GCM10009122_20700 [Fulvivirga kasyanovii]|uniref:hypothetical protein n=1 Tax=Fulvivirga kasyanovii TaxID=396812 RepID=UPI0031D96CCC